MFIENDDEINRKNTAKTQKKTKLVFLNVLLQKHPKIHTLAFNIMLENVSKKVLY